MQEIRFGVKYLCLIILLFNLSACDKKQMVEHLTITPIFQEKLASSHVNQIINCKTSFSYKNNQWHYQQLQFFITNVALKNKQGKWQSWLMKKNAYQSNNLALIGENCTDSSYKVNNSKQKQSQIENKGHWQIEFLASHNLQNFIAIRFTLGVPFTLNHLNPLTQASPLNDSSMFWVWQTGHKFLRLELASDNGEQWLFHLGSTGCKSSSVMRSPKGECLQPNRVNVELPLTKHPVSALAFDLNALLNNMLINEQRFCQSSPQNDACRPLFSALGLSGNITGNNKKTAVFKVITNE